LLTDLHVHLRRDELEHTAAEHFTAANAERYLETAAELGVHHVTHSFGSTVPTHRLQAAEELTRPLWEANGHTPPPLCGVFADVYVSIRPPSLPGQPPEGTHLLLERPMPLDAVGGELPETRVSAGSRFPTGTLVAPMK